jgi:hypothetical protein
MEEALPPARLLAGDVEATQRADDGYGENERALAHERLEKQPHGDKKRRQHRHELGEFEDAVE